MLRCMRGALPRSPPVLLGVVYLDGREFGNQLGYLGDPLGKYSLGIGRHAYL